MRTFKLLIILSVILIPSFACGYAQPCLFGSEIFSLAHYCQPAYTQKSEMPAFALRESHGDIIIGKNFCLTRNPHSWDTALSLLVQPDKSPDGFVGYVTPCRRYHSAREFHERQEGYRAYACGMRAGSIIDRKYWYLAVNIDRSVQQRNDLFLERSFERALFSFKTNKKIFKGILLLSCFNQERVGEIIQKNALRSAIPSRKKIENLHGESIDRMIDILRNGEDSKVINESPMVRFRKAS